ncbi:ATPase [Brevirhabdus pacifica]|uniref:ATPase n=1 Tax=Brevirhabdus pacifica TaxID=1267768 RepID=A0A1U7DLZ7_9RHOB|nr:ATPase [Brevirhabdus pacifica]APX90899.1 ATPase [Brevirhabdus pacifica]OWU80335.1 ATPase [Loktanella sp. 22II-4b]
MLYADRQQWEDASARRVLLFGMSGLGKTHISSMLRDDASWFHFSVDYRIGTRYMGEHIVDNFKREAMKTPFLAELLRSDSIYIGSNITFDNLSPLSTYLGKPGDPERGGLPIEEYRRRQAQHRVGEIAALMDTPHFIARASEIYGYENFVCDTGGSICEVVDPDDPEDPVLTTLSRNLLLVWIRGSDDHVDELERRFRKSPKPMYYRPDFRDKLWDDYLRENAVTPDQVDPDAFVRWAYRQAMDHRQPIYDAMARKWGVTVDATDVARVRDEADFNALIGEALGRRAAEQ